MRCCRPCWIGCLGENYEKRPIPRPLPKWEGVPAGEGLCVEDVTVRATDKIIKQIMTNRDT